ncbi:C-5 cytosine-specific DNA methylase [Thoreauomyces humboldtii]|nr:C-5 cytosine-specific DNA methylase [Thoreauomyces humboldtii]
MDGSRTKEQPVDDTVTAEIPPIRALEFFSGLGGLHYALDFCNLPDARVVAAFDINEHANSCYLHNFGLKPTTRGIEYLSASAIDKLNANAWFLSPPCQPYTQGGKSLDNKDARANGLLHLVELLGEIQARPEFVFVEVSESIFLREEHWMDPLLLHPISWNYHGILKDIWTLTGHSS